MRSPDAKFIIIKSDGCPCYTEKDVFILSGQAYLFNDGKGRSFITTSVVKVPENKRFCSIVARDITGVVVKYADLAAIPDSRFECGGCEGRVTLEHRRRPAARGKGRGSDPSDLSAAVGLLYIFPIFQNFDEDDIEKIVPLLKLKKFPKGADIIRRGDPGTNLYIIISGKVDVLAEDGISIGILNRGDVFGEISLLIGTPIGATIRVLEPTRTLFITGHDFKNMLRDFPTLQNYFARLLAERLARTNDERISDIQSGMIGMLSEMPPAELLQTLNLNRKTGVLNLALPGGAAKVFFREGGLIGARYGDRRGEEAFFDILAEKKGRFKFAQGLPPDGADIPEIGDFMWLLMEGTRRMDEVEK